MSEGGKDPPWKRVQFVSLSPFLQWRDFQLQAKAPTTTPISTTLSDLQSQVLKIKDTIGEFKNQDEWENRKKITNPYEYIFAMQDATLPGVLHQSKQFSPLSRSYFKMIEMLHILDFFKIIKQEKLQSSHVCEGPGGFIQAFLIQASKYKRTVSAAYAMTLKPTESCIPGWRRSVHYLREHPEIILEYGKDSTGNILNIENQNQYIARCAHKSMLFTADEGFDFSNDYSSQEHTAFPLILASFRMGLQTLAKGGCMIIKVFDVFQEFTKQLLIGSGMCFERFTVYKPATSRPCNSERYFIGKGFVGAQMAGTWIQHVEIVYRRLQQSGTPVPFFTTPFTPSLYAMFEDQMIEQAHLQIQSIQSILDYTPEQKEVSTKKGMLASEEWVRVFN